jgi:hypothetical protein
MSDSIDVSILIISYNTRDFILPCLKSVFEETKEVSFEVIVLDNDSSDDTCESIKAEFPEVRLIENKDNVGFARGNNIASEQAVGRRILLLNPDTLVLENAIDKLVRFSDEHPDNRVWGGKHLFGDRTLNKYNCWGDYSIWSVFCSTFALPTLFSGSRLFNPRGYPKYDRQSIRVVDSITGCYLMIDRELWVELDGFAEEFFLFAEEIDLCRRARDKGAQPLVTPDSVIVHYGGGSAPLFSENKKVQLLRAERQYYRKHLGAVGGPFACFLSDLGVVLRAALIGCLRMIGKREGPNMYGNLMRRRTEWA